MHTFLLSKYQLLAGSTTITLNKKCPKRYEAICTIEEPLHSSSKTIVMYPLHCYCVYKFKTQVHSVLKAYLIFWVQVSYSIDAIFFLIT